jgi:Sec23/Sec24 zinc finger
VHECDSDDLDGDLNLSDSENGSSKRASFKRQRRQKKKRDANKYAVEADTNIFQISLSCLKNAGAMATGDPALCEKCQGVFNSSSQLKPVMGKESKIWPCEFCNHENEIFIDDEEIPKINEVNYLVEAAAQVQDKKMGGNQDISVIFCIDISGSMCVS